MKVSETFNVLFDFAYIAEAASNGCLPTRNFNRPDILRGLTLHFMRIYLFFSVKIALRII